MSPTEQLWEDSPPVAESPIGLDLRFYTDRYNISIEEKRMLAELVTQPSFRVFEKYLDWRINALAHRMVNAESDPKAAEVRAEIRALAKIPTDLKNFWEEAKTFEEASLNLEQRQSARERIFGKDRYPLVSPQDNEDIILS